MSGRAPGDPAAENTAAGDATAGDATRNAAGNATGGRPTAISLLQRRGIEAEVLIPLIRRMERELGRELAHRLARETIEEIAQEQGRAVREALGRDDLAGFHEVRDSWGGAGGDLTIETRRADARHLDFDVTRCRFAELYRGLGAPDLGFLLSCNRDFTLSAGYSDRLRLRRTQTIMEGASFCDFRYTFQATGGASDTSGGDGGGGTADDGTAEQTSDGAASDAARVGGDDGDHTPTARG